MIMTMCQATPYELARQVYANEPSARTGDEEVRLALLNPLAIVIKTPGLFMVTRPVNTAMGYKEMTDPSVQAEECNAWWIHVLATKRDYKSLHFLASLLISLPWEFQWIGWERKNVPRFYTLEKVLNHVELMFD